MTFVNPPTLVMAGLWHFSLLMSIFGEASARLLRGIFSMDYLIYFQCFVKVLADFEGLVACFLWCWLPCCCLRGVLHRLWCAFILTLQFITKIIKLINQFAFLPLKCNRGKPKNIPTTLMPTLMILRMPYRVISSGSNSNQQIRLKIIQKSRMLHLVKKFFRQFDMFNSPATLRTKGEPQARNTCAGIFSFLILLIFGYVFISQFIQTTNWQNINATTTQSNTVEANTNRNISKFMIGVGVEGFRIEGITQYLRFQILQVVKNGSAVVSRTKLLTQKCRLDHWSQLGDQATISQNYIRYNLKNKLCLVPNQTLSIEQPSNKLYSILVVEVNACRRMDRQNNHLYEGCASENLTETKNQQLIELNKYFVANVVYINTVFNPLSKLPTKKTLQTQRLTFTISQGSEAFIYLSTYEIKTDTSIWPLQAMESEAGYSFDKSEMNVFEIVWYFEHASCTFQLSSSTVLYERSIGKMDELLAYAGGLFGLIIAILSVFMMSFDEYRYEIMAAQSAFNLNNQGRKIYEENFTFFLYLKYQIFDWIKTLLCLQIPWRDCKQIDETREESTSQLDISLILKKLVYFQKFIEHVISDREKIALFLTEHPSIKQVRRNRLIAQYYDKVLQKQTSITMENAIIVNGIFEMISDNRIASKMGSQSEFNESRGELNLQERTLERILEAYDKEYSTKEEIDFTEEELQVEKQITLALFSLPQETRKNFMNKIPLKILSRLYKVKNERFQTQFRSINLQV